MSADSAFEEERADILASGFDDFLCKPLRGADLFALAERHLAQVAAALAAWARDFQYERILALIERGNG